MRSIRDGVEQTIGAASFNNAGREKKDVRGSKPANFVTDVLRGNAGEIRARA